MRHFRPSLALALACALVAGLLVPWSFRYWPVTVAIAALSIVGLAWAVVAREVHVPAPMVLAAGIGGWGFLQLALHKTAIPFMTLKTAIVWLMCAVAFFLSSQIVRHARDRRAFLLPLLWSIVFLAVEAMLQMATQPVRVFGIFPAADSVFGTIFYTNQFAGMMEMAAPVALWLVLRGRVVAGGLAYAALFAATVASASRTGVLLVFGELVVFFILTLIGRRMPARAAASMVGILLALMAVAGAVAGPEKVWERFQERNPYAVRNTLTRSTVAMAKASPWFGFGLGTWRSAYPRFATMDVAALANEAHNDWAQWAAEGGFPFALLLAVLVLWLIGPALQSVWGLGVPVAMLHAWVDYPLREPALQFLWFALAGALAQARSSGASSEE